MNDFTTAILEKKDALQIHQMGFTPIADVHFSETVRHLCEANACGGYGSSWVCPPGLAPMKSAKQPFRNTTTCLYLPPCMNWKIPMTLKA